MADAGYTDLRGQELLPLLLRMMKAGTLTGTQQQVVDLMQQWIDDGSAAWINGRQGSVHGGVIGTVTANTMRAQVVLMDAWYLHLMDTMTTQLAALAPIRTLMV